MVGSLAARTVELVLGPLDHSKAQVTSRRLDRNDIGFFFLVLSFGLGGPSYMGGLCPEGYAHSGTLGTSVHTVYMSIYSLYHNNSS